ncbi:MAG: type II toxin-antitoxin system RelE/ParE family toxin [Verrucomicrobiota bacterium]
MLGLRLHPEADAEAIDAAEWIKADDPRQGALFVEAVEEALINARTQHGIYRVFDGEFRKVRVGKFRYAVVFRVKENEVQVLAVMHLHRRPNYWKTRVKD